MAAHLQVLARTPDTLLIIAPRHTKRGDPLRKMAQDLGITAAQRSAGDKITAQTQIYIADTLGELGVFFSLSPVTFMGGSFGQEGGHNPYEPAHFATALMHGPEVRNFADAYAALNAAGAAIAVPLPEALGPAVVSLLHGDHARVVADAGQRFMQQTGDCTDRTTGLIKAALSNAQD